MSRLFDRESLTVYVNPDGTWTARILGLEGEGQGSTHYDAVCDLVVIHANGVRALAVGLSRLKQELRRLGGAGE